MCLRNHLIAVLMLAAASLGAAGSAWADAPAAATGDVTMTVIPSGVDVVKTVVQNISVPANADKLAKAKGAAPSKAAQDGEAPQQTAQQLAEAAAEHQAGQTQQQLQQQALQAQIAAKTRNPPAPPPPPPPKPPLRR